MGLVKGSQGIPEPLAGAGRSQVFKEGPGNEDLGQGVGEAGQVGASGREEVGLDWAILQKGEGRMLAWRCPKRSVPHRDWKQRNSVRKGEGEALHSCISCLALSLCC